MMTILLMLRTCSEVLHENRHDKADGQLIYSRYVVALRRWKVWSSPVKEHKSYSIRRQVAAGGRCLLFWRLFFHFPPPPPYTVSSFLCWEVEPSGYESDIGRSSRPPRQQFTLFVFSTMRRLKIIEANECREEPAFCVICCIILSSKKKTWNPCDSFRWWSLWKILFIHCSKAIIKKIVLKAFQPLLVSKNATQDLKAELSWSLCIYSLSPRGILANLTGQWQWMFTFIAQLFELKIQYLLSSSLLSWKAFLGESFTNLIRKGLNNPKSCLDTSWSIWVRGILGFW